MCDCCSDIEKSLLARFQEQQPEATGHTVSLKGYAFILGANVTLKGCMPIEMKATYPLKKGGTKERVSKTNMMFTFCPYCGVKYDEA